jgi:hypothetical protein
MKRASIGLAIAIALMANAAAPARFQKLTDHYYLLPGAHGGFNIGAFLSDDGLLLVNVAGPNDLPGMLEALKRASSKPVRWVVGTDYRKETWSWPGPLLAQGASLLTSKAAFEQSRADAVQSETPSPGLLVFGRQMRLFPGGVEVRVFAPEGKSRTGDVVVFVPSERVLQVGDIFQPGSFPMAGENAAEGAALGWIDALKQAVDLVPLLKSAMPQPKTEPVKPGTEEKEKTLEEMIVVIPARGPVSNLQEMKNLLEQAQKLRAEMVRAISAKRTHDSFVASAAAAPFRAVANFESFAARLYQDLSSPKP